METNRYKNASIYKLCCKDPTITDIYVGSTCAFRNRKYGHKGDCNNESSPQHNYPVYKFIRANGGWNNWEMIELLKYPCNTKRELELKEREYLEMLGGTLNKHIPTRTNKEWRIDRKEHVSNWQRINHQKNKESINKRHRINHQKNKESINKRHRLNYEANKEKLCEKFNCECGGKFTKCNKAHHFKTPKHQKYLNEIKE